MRHLVPLTMATLGLIACGGGEPAKSPTSGAETASAPPVEPTPAPETTPESQTGTQGAGDGGGSHAFDLRESDTAKDAHGATASKLAPSKTEALVKFIVVDKDKGPIPGIVVSLTAPDAKKYYTEETDAQGYAEVLVPVGQKYDLIYLSLGRKDVAATVPVTAEPNQNIKLTLRYKRERPAESDPAPHFVLKGINFDTGKATIRPESFASLDSVVDYMAHKKSSRIEISGHTDNVGKPNANKTLSQKRAEACRNYLISKGIDGNRIEAKGYGDERPVAPNDSDEGRQKNRRIEATEL